MQTLLYTFIAQCRLCSTHLQCNADIAPRMKRDIVSGTKKKIYKIHQLCLGIYITIVTTFGNKMILRDGTFKVVPYFCIYFHNPTLIKFRVGNFSETPCTCLSEQAHYSTGMSTVCLKQQVSNKIKVYGLSYPILDTRISSGLRQAQATPPGFGNGLDWRALVKE